MLKTRTVLVIALVLATTGCGKRERKPSSDVADGAVTTRDDKTLTTSVSPTPLKTPTSTPPKTPIAIEPPPAKTKDDSGPITFRPTGKITILSSTTPTTLDLAKSSRPKVDVLKEKSFGMPANESWSDPIRALPDGTILLVGYPNKLVILNLDSGMVVGEIQLPSLRNLVDIDISRDGTFAVIAGQTNGKYPQNLVTVGVDIPKRVQRWSVPNGIMPQGMISLNYNGEKAYSSGLAPAPGPFWMVKSQTGEIEECFSNDQFKRGVAYPDNDQVMLLSAGSDLGFHLVLHPPKGKKKPIRIATLDGWAAITTRAMKFSPSGKLFAWGLNYRMVVLSSETGEMLHNIAYEKPVTDPRSVSFSADDRYLTWHGESSAGGGAAHVIDLATGTELLRVGTAPLEGTMVSVAFSPDDRQLLLIHKRDMYMVPIPSTSKQ